MDQFLSFSLPLTRGQPFTFRDLADVYISCRRTVSPSLRCHMAFWVLQLGDKVTSDISSGRLILGGGWCRL